MYNGLSYMNHQTLQIKAVVMAQQTVTYSCAMLKYQVEHFDVINFLWSVYRSIDHGKLLSVC